MALAEQRGVREQLNPTAGVLEHAEDQLAHLPSAHQSTGHRERIAGHRLRFEPGIALVELGCRDVGGEAMGQPRAGRIGFGEPGAGQGIGLEGSTVPVLAFAHSAPSVLS